MTTTNKSSASAMLIGAAFIAPLLMAHAASALTVSCVGAPSSTNIAWSASSSGGIDPVGYLWGNGDTSTSQTVSYAPGTHSMTIQATDASSSLATSTCAATIAALPAPSIASFAATPSTITIGQSAVLSWMVTNASSTSIDKGVGTVSSTSVTVSPAVTTTYTLSATNPQGTANKTATVTVHATTSGNTDSGTFAQIQALLAQIASLKAQIAQLIINLRGGGTATTTPPTIPQGKFCKDAIGRDIRRGDYGDDIKDLQKFLAKHPNIYPEGIVNGFYGPLTMQAVQRWQKINGIDSTGFFGPISRKFWRERCPDDWFSATSSVSASTSVSSWIDQMISNGPEKNDKNKGQDDDREDDDRDEH